jgi:cytochrome c553
MENDRMKLILGAYVCLLAMATTLPLMAAPQQSDPPEGSVPAASSKARIQLTAEEGHASMEAPAELQNPNLPSWAFTPGTPPNAPRRQRPQGVQHVPNSDRGYTWAEINNGFGPPDWFPNSHPPAPKSVLEGHRPDVRACALCHLPTGYGRPENSGLTGLTADYILQQLSDFKHDLRHNSVAHMGAADMIPIANRVSPEDAREAAEYFASVKPVKWIYVQESATAPKVRAGNRMWLPDEDGATEPIGERVVEVPKNTELVEMRDTAIPFIAYVPPGSLKRGEDLVRTGGNGKTVACVICHGEDLRGMGDFVPSIAGRSPSSLGRQLFDFQTGARHGANAALMKAPVSKLTNADIVAITAYLASLNP